MKRMNEVFNVLMVKNVFYENDSQRWICAFVDEEKAQHAAHAINHVDALADALESLIDTVQHDHWVSFKGSNPEAAELPNCYQLFEDSNYGASLRAKTQDAIETLNAYRGAK